MTRDEWLAGFLLKPFEKVSDNPRVYVERDYKTIDVIGDVAIIYARERFVSDGKKPYYGLDFAKFFLWKGDKLVESHDSYDYIRERFWELVW